MSEWLDKYAAAKTDEERYTVAVECDALIRGHHDNRPPPHWRRGELKAAIEAAGDYPYLDLTEWDVDRLDDIKVIEMLLAFGICPASLRSTRMAVELRAHKVEPCGQRYIEVTMIGRIAIEDADWFDRESGRVVFVTRG